MSLTESGNEQIEELLREAGLLKEGDLYDAHNATLVHHVNQALRAHTLFQRDKDYIVRNGEVVIIDEFTGRMMPGRRYSEGLHQALEAKERVQVQPENQTLASITFQNYFRLYEKLAGMTGTAATEADEFLEIYNLEVVEIPTNRPVARVDEDDEVYRTAEEKYKGIIREIEAASDARPADAGRHDLDREIRVPRRAPEARTASRRSTSRTRRRWSRSTRRPARARAVRHFAVLNARFHEQEAFIVAQAGVPGAITIATNMAGRGTDIQLGGNAKMRIEHELGAGLEGDGARRRGGGDPRRDRPRSRSGRSPAGGLYVLGTERHESPAHRQPAARPLRPPGRSRAARSSTCRCRTT